jgi:DNA-binding transcriptional MerR regulator
LAKGYDAGMIDSSISKEFLCIKEFAELIGMTVPTLRFYDRIGIFTPAKRGIGHENRYRYYSPNQITTVKMIRVLTDIGVPLKTIKELTHDRTPEKIFWLLSKYKNKVSGEISFWQEANSVISTFMDLLNEALCVAETELSVAEMPKKGIILSDIIGNGGESGLIKELMHFCRSQHEPKPNMSFPIGTFFENMEVFLKEPSRPTRLFSLDPKGHERKESGLYLIGYTRGYYGQTNNLPKQMVEFAKTQGLVFTGPVYNLYLSDEISEIDPEQYLLQVSVPVKETRRSFSPRQRR